MTRKGLGLTPKQLELRRSVLGGTDAAALLGLSRWKRSIDVYAEKVGEAPPRGDMSEAALWGLILEPVILEQFQQRTGLVVRKPSRLLRHRQRRWQGAHLDGRGPGLLVEVKTARTAEGWGETGTDQIPPDYKAQVWHYMAVTGLRQAAVAALIGGSDFRIYWLDWKPEIDDLTEEEAAFWAEHVLPRVPPEPDGSAAAERYLRRRYPVDDGSELVALPHQYPIIEDYLNARRRAAMWGEQEARLQQALMAAMGPAQRLLAPGVKIVYGTAKDSERVAWKEYAEGLRGIIEGLALGTYPITMDPLAAADTLRSLHTSQKEGTRRWLVKEQKEKEIA